MGGVCPLKVNIPVPTTHTTSRTPPSRRPSTDNTRVVGGGYIFFCGAGGRSGYNSTVKPLLASLPTQLSQTRTGDATSLWGGVCWSMRVNLGSSSARPQW